MLVVIVLGIAVIAAVIAGVFFNMYRILDRSPERAMVSFQLNPDETKHEFLVLVAAHVFQTVVMAGYAVAGATGHELGTQIGLGLTAVYGAVVTRIYYRWWRRF